MIVQPVPQHVPQHGVVLRVLLRDAIDYAGLFPPAQLDMAGAVAAYASYLESTDSWALGRFVVPAARLDELARVADERVRGTPESLGATRFWRLSVLFGPDVRADAERVHAFRAEHGVDRGGWWAWVDGIELRAATPEAIDDALRVVPTDVDRFVEIPIDGDVRALVAAIGKAGAFAKVRTGGTSADAFPTSDDLIRFLAACTAEQVPFKATAGLHHPLRGQYPLTYTADSARGTMYGFLNVFLATAFLRAGADEHLARHILEEQDASAIRFDDAGVTWRGHRLSDDQLQLSRVRAARSFGSCSFREPLDDLTSLGML